VVLTVVFIVSGIYSLECEFFVVSNFFVYKDFYGGFVLMCCSLSHSTMSISSSSSLGSLTSTGSQGSQSSVAASLSDIYLDPCQRLTYKVLEIDRDALFQRVERLLKCRDDLPQSSAIVQFNDGMSRTSLPHDLVNSSSDVSSSGVGCLPTYEQHLERQRCRRTPLPATQPDAVYLSSSLHALELGPFTSQLLASASASADCQRPLTEMVVTDDDVQSDYHLQPSLSTDLGASLTPGYVCLGQSDASSGVSGEGVGGSDSALAGEVNRSTSRHVSSSSATESDSGICDAAVTQ